MYQYSLSGCLICWSLAGIFANFDSLAAPGLTCVSHNHIVRAQLTGFTEFKNDTVVEAETRYLGCNLSLKLACPSSSQPLLALSFKKAGLVWSAISQLGMFYMTWQSYSVTGKLHHGTLRVSSDESGYFQAPQIRYTNGNAQAFYRNFEFKSDGEFFNSEAQRIEITLYPVFIGYAQLLDYSENGLTFTLERVLPELSLYLASLQDKENRYSLITPEFVWSSNDKTCEVRTGLHYFSGFFSNTRVGVKIPEWFKKDKTQILRLYDISPDDTIKMLCKGFVDEEYKKYQYLTGYFKAKPEGRKLRHFLQLCGTSAAVSSEKVKEYLAQTKSDREGELKKSLVKYDLKSKPALNVKFSKAHQAVYIHLDNPVSVQRDQSVTGKSFDFYGCTCNVRVFPAGTTSDLNQVIIELFKTEVYTPFNTSETIQGFCFQKDHFPSLTAQKRYRRYHSFDSERRSDGEGESEQIIARVSLCQCEELDPDMIGQVCFRICPVIKPSVTHSADATSNTDVVNCEVDASTLVMHSSSLFKLVTPSFGAAEKIHFSITINNIKNIWGNVGKSFSVNMIDGVFADSDLETVTLRYKYKNDDGAIGTRQLFQLPPGTLQRSDSTIVSNNYLKGAWLQQALAEDGRLKFEVSFKYKERPPLTAGNQPFTAKAKPVVRKIKPDDGSMIEETIGNPSLINNQDL